MDFRGGVSRGPFGGPNRFWASKVGPQRSQSVSNDRKKAKHDTKEPADCEKELQKSSLFGAWPGGLRETLTIRPPPLLAKGSLGVLDQRLDSCLSLTL